VTSSAILRNFEFLEGMCKTDLKIWIYSHLFEWKHLGVLRVKVTGWSTKVVLRNRQDWDEGVMTRFYIKDEGKI
jgi:hypothetical protein